MARIRETRRHSLKRKKECDDESEGEEPPLNAAMLESDTEDEGPDFSTATGIVAYLQANWESCHRLDAKLPDDKDQFQKAVTLVAEVLGTRKKEGANCHEFPQFNNQNRPLLSGVQMVNRCAIEILEYYGSEREMFDIPGLETLLFKWTGYLLEMKKETPELRDIPISMDIDVMFELIESEYSSDDELLELDLSVQGLFEGHLELNPTLFPRGWGHFQQGGKRSENERDVSGVQAFLFIVYISFIPMVEKDGKYQELIVNRVRVAFSELAKREHFGLMKIIGYLLFVQAPHEISELEFAHKVCDATGKHGEFFVTQVLQARKAPKQENNCPSPHDARDLQSLCIIWVSTILLRKMNVMNSFERMHEKEVANYKRIKRTRSIYDGLSATGKPFTYHLGYDVAIRNWARNNTQDLVTVAEAEKKKKPRGRPPNDNTVKARLDQLEKTMAEVTSKVDEGFQWLRSTLSNQNSTRKNDGSKSRIGGSRVQDVEEVPVVEGHGVASGVRRKQSPSQEQSKSPAQGGTKKVQGTKKVTPDYDGDKKPPAQEKPKAKSGVQVRAATASSQGKSAVQRQASQEQVAASSQGKSVAQRPPSKSPQGLGVAARAPQSKSVVQRPAHKSPQKQFAVPAVAPRAGGGQLSLFGIGGRPIPRKGAVKPSSRPDDGIKRRSSKVGRKKAVAAYEREHDAALKLLGSDSSDDDDEVELVGVKPNDQDKKRKHEEEERVPRKIAKHGGGTRGSPPPKFIPGGVPILNDGLPPVRRDEFAKRSPLSQEFQEQLLREEKRKFSDDSEEEDKEEAETAAKSVAHNKLDNFHVDLENGEEFPENENEQKDKEDNEKWQSEDENDGGEGETEEQESHALDNDQQPDDGREYAVENEEGNKRDA